MGQATAKMNIQDLRKVLGLSDDETSVKSPDVLTPPEQAMASTPPAQNSNEKQIETAAQRFHRVRRESMEQLNLIKVESFVCFVFIFIFNLSCGLLDKVS